MPKERPPFTKDPEFAELDAALMEYDKSRVVSGSGDFGFTPKPVQITDDFRTRVSRFAQRLGVSTREVYSELGIPHEA
jgi:hypothetical protein